MSKAPVTSSVIVTDIPVKPNFQREVFELHTTDCSDRDLGPMTSSLNCDLDISLVEMKLLGKAIPKVYPGFEKICK